MDFQAANQTIHAVETQWHYSILTRYGFRAETPSAQGFVRSYTYTHPSGASVMCVTGSNADYWRAGCGAQGFWTSLEDWAASVSACV